MDRDWVTYLRESAEYYKRNQLKKDLRDAADYIAKLEAHIERLEEQRRALTGW